MDALNGWMTDSLRLPHPFGTLLSGGLAPDFSGQVTNFPAPPGDPAPYCKEELPSCAGIFHQAEDNAVTSLKCHGNLICSSEVSPRSP